MNPSLAFAYAARPRRVVILRLPMLDYSIGHEIILTQKRNPLLGDRQAFFELPLNTQCAAIIQAALVCSRTWAQNKLPERNLRLWTWLNRKTDYRAAMLSFMSYRSLGATFPEIVPPDSDGRCLGSPLMARLAAFTQDFDTPLGLAQWLYFSHCETLGHCKVENDDERGMREEEARIRAEYAKEKERKCPR